MTKIRITRGDGWYAESVGAEFEVIEEDFIEEEGQVYFVDPEGRPRGRRFVKAVDCEIVSEEVAELRTVDVITTPPVKVGDYVRINKCEECPESEGKYGSVIRTGTATDADFDVDIPSKVYGDYTWIDADCDEWSVFPKTDSESDAVSPPGMSDKYPKYYKDVSAVDSVDVYKIHEIFEIDDPSGAIHHASKKLLLSGSRTGGKSKYDDVREARDTLTRWLDLQKEGA